VPKVDGLKEVDADLESLDVEEKVDLAIPKM
jgi:hypothetical protein